MHHRYMHHTYMHASESLICASYTHASESRIEEHRYMHHTCMYQDQASWINASYIYMCIKKYRIIYTYTSPDSCIIRIMEQNHRFVHCASFICASYIHVSGSCILLLESPCSFVRSEQNFSRIIHTCSIVKYQGSWMYASYINASCTYAS